MEHGFHGHFEPLRMPRGAELTSEQFWQLCQLNRDWRFERNPGGEIKVMPPTGGITGARSLNIAVQLGRWSERDGSGAAFDSSTGFALPNGAIRSPDAAWVSRERLSALTEEEKERFLPLCPDFVLELRSPSDGLNELLAKVCEYVQNGARLAWLIDPVEGCAYVSRPGSETERFELPDKLSGDPELPGFVLELAQVWTPNL